MLDESDSSVSTENAIDDLLPGELQELRELQELQELQRQELSEIEKEVDEIFKSPVKNSSSNSE